MRKFSFPKIVPGKQKRRGGLQRSMLGMLVVFSLIPLLLMAGATYLASRNLLRAQAVAQMQSLVTGQMKDAQDRMKIKQIRLDRTVHRPDFASAVQTLLHQTRVSPYFIEGQRLIASVFDELNREGVDPIFNQYFIIDPSGEVLTSSTAEWNGKNIKASSLFGVLRSADAQSYGVYDFTPFYPGQFILLTVDQYRTSDGVARATIVGISEQQSAAQILKSIEDLSPSSRAYFVSNYGGFISLDQYTGDLSPFVSSPDQRDALNLKFDPMKQTGSSFAPATVAFKNERGEPVIAQAAWLKELNIGIVLEVPSSSIFGQLSSLIPFTILVFVGLAIALALAIRWYTNRVVKPILSLSTITTRYAEGDLEGRATIQGNDEIGLLSGSFNRMADQLNVLYASLQSQVEERTRQIRTAAEVAQGLTTAFNLDELLQKTVQLIVDRFSFYYAGIFMIEEGGRYATLRAAHGPAAEEMLKRGHRHEIGSASIVGWVSANLKPRVASDVEMDPVHYRNELLPNTRAEVGIPIVLGGVILAVLDVQSEEPHTFDDEMIIVLQTLANQIAAAIQNATLVDNEQSATPGTDRLYRAALGIAQASSEADVLEAAGRAMKESRHPSIILKTGKEFSETISVFNPFHDIKPNFTKKVAVTSQEIQRQISGPLLINDLAHAEDIPAGLAQILRENDCQSGAILPVLVNGQIFGLIMIGELPGQPLTSAVVRPYTIIPDLMSATMERVGALNESQTRLSQLEALTAINRTTLSASNVQSFYATLQEQISRVIGNYSFVIALYDAHTNSINIPYLYEEGKTDTIEPFPLGEGLTSILIRTRRPLLLVEDTERQALALGAKIHGKPARSWMGVPLLIGEEAIGALIIQDPEHEHQFNEQHLSFMTEAAKQMAGVINNVRLLDQSRRTALQLQTAAEIARDISGSLNLDELLLRAVNLIRERFEFYHASVFLVDMHGEFAVIREATGEAGAQLKRMGHKLGVGSKSIVGYVTGRGETLVVNDTAKDATYYANPVLPDTRSEGAIPLKVGERILGALDVQSNAPFAFSEDNLRTLEILADQLAVAVVNTELFAETQEHLSQHRLLHHITTTAASGTTLEEALEATVKGLQVTLGGDRVSILLVDRDRKMLELRASIGYSEEVANVRVPVGQGITGWAASHRRPLRVDDVTKDSRYIQVSSNTRSELAIPLLYRNELLGVLNAESEQTSAYTENDEEMLGTLAGSLAAIIANARLLEQIRRQAERERQLYDVTSKIRRSTDIQTIMATTASELTKTIGARRAEIRIESVSAGNGSPKQGSA
jgi:GAF domain-containing protein/HAMP domain-containing protein